MNEIKISRRAFLKGTGATLALLSLNSLGFLGGNSVANATEKVVEDWNYAGGYLYLLIIFTIENFEVCRFRSNLPKVLHLDCDIETIFFLRYFRHT